MSYVLTLREALAGTKIVASDRFWEPIATDLLNSPALRNATAGICQPNGVAAHAEYGLPLYSTEDYSCWTDDDSAVQWASKLSSNGNITFFSAWYLLTSFYPSVAFWNDGAFLRAAQPWSSHFDLSPALWATAHYTQFTQPPPLLSPQSSSSSSTSSSASASASASGSSAGLWRYLLQGHGPASSTAAARTCRWWTRSATSRW